MGFSGTLVEFWDSEQNALQKIKRNVLKGSFIAGPVHAAEISLAFEVRATGVPLVV